MHRISTEEEKNFYNKIKKVYGGENYIDNKKCKFWLI